MASRKYGDMVGSPPENCTDIWRRGLICSALSRISFTSSHVNSWTNPTWLASIKHGSHIMLQRLVRSTVSTDPRPCLMVLEPWLCNFSSLWERMSRPGKFFSIQARKFTSLAMMSSKWPWMGQSFTIQTAPSRSIMLALISPTFSVSSDCQSCSPLMMRSRASFTQRGQSESVWRGKPNGGLVFSQDFSRGFSDHLGVNDGFGLYLLKNWMESNATPAVTETARSKYFMSRLPFALGIVFVPLFIRDSLWLFGEERYMSVLRRS